LLSINLKTLFTHSDHYPLFKADRETLSAYPDYYPSYHGTDEIYPNARFEAQIERTEYLARILQKLPIDEPFLNDTHYFGTIPPNFSEWLSKPVVGYPPHYDSGTFFYRIFKTKNAQYVYALQQLLYGGITHHTIAGGDYLEDIIEVHNRYTKGTPPCFIQPQNISAD